MLTFNLSRVAITSFSLSTNPPPSMSNACTPSVRPGAELPYRTNGTYICGVNPYTSPTLLAHCCHGPITNITTPAPTTGPYSDSWPLTCLAYCAVTKPPDGPPYTNPFSDCLNPNGSITIGSVCTEANGFAPNECVPFQESAGCTSANAYTTSTYWPLGYTSAGVTVSGSSAASSVMEGSATTGSTGDLATGSSMGSVSITSSAIATASAAPSSACIGTEVVPKKIAVAIFLFSFLVT
jgi:hypothetical protein